MDQEPDLAILFAKALSSFSLVEKAMGSNLLKILGAHARPGFAMFDSLSSTAARNDVLSAVAIEMLEGSNLRAFAAIRQIVKRMGNQRNKLAHHLWGVCPQVPGALISINPKYALQRDLDFAEFWRKLEVDPAEAFAEFDPLERIRADEEKIFVYRDEDLQKICDDFKETRLLLDTLNYLIEPPSVAHPSFSRIRLLRRLCSQRCFREERKRFRKRRRTNLQSAA